VHLTYCVLKKAGKKSWQKGSKKGGKKVGKKTCQKKHTAIYTTPMLIIRKKTS